MQGCIQYECRTDSQIRARGKLIKLSVIETALQSFHDVDGGVAVVYHAGEQDQAVLAFTVLRSDDNNTLERDRKATEIENVLRAKFSEIEGLRIVVVDTIPLLSNGKIDRQALLRTYENRTKKSE